MNATISDNTPKKLDIRAIFEGIRENPKIVFMIAAAAAISVVVALMFWACSPDYKVLYTNVSEQDGGAIVAQLTQMQIPYRFAERNGAIMIPEDKVYEVRLKLAQQGLPKGGAVGFELLDQENFGTSQFNEQVNFQRALEGELSRTIQTLGPVQSARVHLAIPKPSLFVREQKSPSVSVTLVLHSGRILDEGQVNAIRYMIAGAVPGLSDERVTIVDQSGHLLTHNGEQETQTSQLKYTKNVENDYQNRIQTILAPIVGMKNVRTEVTAQIDFTQNEKTEEHYQPNSTPEKMAIRSKRSNHSEQGGKPPLGGVPGSLSNQPPTPSSVSMPSHSVKKSDTGKKNINNVIQEKTKVASESFNFIQDETTNYELDRTLKHIKESTGSVKRLSVAVVINYLPAENGKQKPLTKEQMTQITNLIKETMGYSVQRGDTLNVVNTPFTTVDDVVVIPLWKQQEFIHLMMTVARYLFIAVIAWGLWRKGVQPFWLKHQEMSLKRLALEKEARKEEMAAHQRKKESDERAKAQIRVDSELRSQQIRDIAEQSPQIIALVLRQWLNKEPKPL
ncbi:TPA: flagellar basal body M-ring protein FliF [Salmonella enterica]|uniref:Flagellar M-ring protein n=1 Tax=Salmonella enterica TaxID=28901 RepID=A0A757C342_SALER|nr:flagellar M-ring protein FliF [Salmonella enterica subsp. enterica serovar Richmond]HAG0390730.1 flagellar basal body M-ring protein FliF [Salmonella enterica]